MYDPHTPTVAGPRTRQTCLLNLKTGTKKKLQNARVALRRINVSSHPIPSRLSWIHLSVVPDNHHVCVFRQAGLVQLPVQALQEQVLRNKGAPRPHPHSERGGVTSSKIGKGFGEAECQSEADGIRRTAVPRRTQLLSLAQVATIPSTAISLGYDRALVSGPVVKYW